MATLTQKIKLALDESRMLIYGAQILLGFQFSAVLEPGFSELPSSSQAIELITLVILLVTIALIMWPSAYHRIASQGNDTPDLHRFATRVMFIALLPVSAALSFDFFVMGRLLWGVVGGIIVGAALGGASLFFWYGLGALSRYFGWDADAKRKTTEASDQMKPNELYHKVDQVLIEARVVLPGVQALLGFQLAAMLLASFNKLPSSSHYIHFASMLLTTLTVILLMTPAAYHRIVERGEATAHFHRVASNLLLASMVTLPLALCTDLFVVLDFVTGSSSLAIVTSLIILTFFYAVWFGFTNYRKHRATSL